LTAAIAPSVILELSSESADNNDPHCGKPGNAHTTKIVQGWPKFWANFRARIGIFSQSVGPSLAIWTNPEQVLLTRRHEERL
jgi:hypothetical protein